MIFEFHFSFFELFDNFGMFMVMNVFMFKMTQKNYLILYLMDRTKDSSQLACLTFLKIASAIQFNIFKTCLMFYHDVPLSKLFYHFTSYGYFFILL